VKPRSRVCRAAIAALAVPAVLLFAGCTSSAAGPSESSSASTTPTSTAATTSPPSSTSIAPNVSVIASSAVSAPPTSANPWPAELTPDQVTQAQAALAAYSAYWRLIDSAGMQPGADWAAQISEYASGPEKATVLTTLAETAARGQRTGGQTLISPVVTGVQPAQVTISDCIDKSQTEFLDSSGASIKAPNAPGSYIRHPANVQMAQLQDGRWQVVLVSDDWSKTC